VSHAQKIRAAALDRKADLVLQLYGTVELRNAPALDQGWIDAAQAVLEPALRMRLPYGRHGAWSKHLQLLQVTCTVLENWMAVNGTQSTDRDAERLLLRARKLLGIPTV
jgi:hypothetical protein